MIRLAILLLIAFAAACVPAVPAPDTTIRPEPRAQTKPVPTPGDAADDPAIWVHPSDPAKSLILGTDKGGGLHVYELDGSELQVIDSKSRPNNVDVVYGVMVKDAAVDLAVTSSRNAERPGMLVYCIDPVTRRLANVTDGGVIPVFGGTEPYGIGTYRSRKTGKAYAFINNKAGKIEQCELTAKPGGTIAAVKVRVLNVPSQPEGCVADDENGVVFVGEENAGVWRFAAEPDGGDKGTLVIKVGENGLVAEVEGLTLYCAAEGKGYLIVSSQGNNTFKVYERGDTHQFLATIDPAPGKLGKPTDTDGIAVSNRPLGPLFPKGAFVVQDGKVGAKGNQNFKLYGWDDIAAGGRLLIDTDWSPRGK
jgi:3-phytase